MTRPITLFAGPRADLPFEEVCRLASSWGNDGGRRRRISIEWEDAGMGRSPGAPEALEFVRRLASDASEAAFSSEG